MIIEIAQIDTKPGLEAEFEAAVARAAPIFRRAEGCEGMHLQRSVERPGHYQLVVRWRTLENHLTDFQQSGLFAQWRGLVGHCFARLPDVEHGEIVVDGRVA